MENGIRRVSVILLAVLGLAAGAAAAQTSKALLRSGDEEQYLTFKRTFQKMVDAGEIKISAEPYDGAVDLRDCSYGQMYLGSEMGESGSGRTDRLANLAYEIVRLKALMTRLGYPEPVWRPLLVEIEENGKERFNPHEPGHLEKLDQALAAYRRRSAAALPRTIVEGGCGEGEVGIRLVTQPRSGRVRLIPVFFFKLCEVQKIDPDDPRRCDHWREPAEGALLDVVGDYFYQASWPDGARRNGKLSFTSLEDGQTVTIRKP
jgi:hypothetical protein